MTQREGPETLTSPYLAAKRTTRETCDTGWSEFRHVPALHHLLLLLLFAQLALQLLDLGLQLGDLILEIRRLPVQFPLGLLQLLPGLLLLLQPL